jgi:DNA-binding transcriptional regulator YdaS (Cro superfamily)
VLAVVGSALFLALLLGVLAVTAWNEWSAWRRETAAWRRVGKCATDASGTVSCRGVHLVDLALPPDAAACGLGPCTAKVNVEAVADFRAALDEAVGAGLGPAIVQFSTVNRRPCRRAITGAVIPGCVSKHSYGIAVDFRPFADNARWESVVDHDPAVGEVVDVFRRHGFRWGGTFRSNFDPQHLEWIPGHRLQGHR